jgi:hypothetical protein
MVGMGLTLDVLVIATHRDSPKIAQVCDDRRFIELVFVVSSSCSSSSTSLVPFL